MRNGRGTGQRQARHHGQNRRKGHRRQKAQQQVATSGLGQVQRHHVAAANQLAADHATLKKLGVGAHQHDGAQAHDGNHVEEESNDARGVEHRFARLLCVGHGKKAHQNVRQTSDTKHQAQPHGQGGDRIGQQLAGREHVGAQAVHFHGLGQQRIQAKAKLRKRQQHDGRATGQQHAGLDDLHPGGGHHATKDHIDHHQHAHHHQGHVVVQAKQQLDQLTGPHHLCHQVEAHHRERADGRHGAHRALGEAVGGDVGKGELAQVAQALGHQKQDDGPAHKKGHHVDVAIHTVAIDHGRQAQQRGG